MVISKNIWEIMDSPKIHALGFPDLFMGLYKQFDMDIPNNHHIRHTSKLDNSFVSRYCIGDENESRNNHENLMLH